MEETVEQSPDKTKKRFETIVKQLADTLRGESNLLPTNKVNVTELDFIVEELQKEQKERNAKEIKEQLTSLLHNYSELKAAVKQKQKELEKLEQDKMKEFIKAAEQLFKRVEKTNQQAAEMREGLNALSVDTPTEPTP